MSFDELSQRKQKILKILIERYLASAEPVSSKEIQEEEMQEYSSATIRSDLATLEEMGYLIKPHVSAGRQPSPKAYKLYVDKLMCDQPLVIEDLDRLKAHCQKKFNDVEEIIRSTAKIISDVTNYTSVVVMNEAVNLLVNDIKLVDLGGSLALVIIMTDSGMISDKTIIIPEGVGNNYFIIANEMIKRLFNGKTLGEISGINKSITEEMKEFKCILNDIIEIMTEYSRNPKVFLEGANKIFDYPEYNDIGHAKEFMSLVDSKERLSELMDESEGIEFQLKIGKDDSGLDNCAIVTAKYILGGKEMGYAGVIGPERMDYNKVLMVLNYINKTLKSIDGQDNKKNDDKE